jgi:sugar/nucleoside kinase (ribokinase family)
MPEFLVAGTICVDLIPSLDAIPPLDPGHLFEVGALDMRPGGCVANTALALAQLGGDVAVGAAIGDDALGAMLLRSLEAEPIRTEGIVTTHGAHTSYSLVIEADDWDRTFWHHAGANARFDGATLDLNGTPVLHLGYPALLPALLANDGAALLALLERAQAGGVTVSLDLAAIPPERRTDAWPAFLQRILPLTDVFVPSRDDLGTMLGSAAEVEDEQLLELLIGWGAAVVALKCGGRGMCLRAASRTRLRRAGAVISAVAGDWADATSSARAYSVVSGGTTGAGDAASAGLIFAITRGFGPERALRLAAAAGAAAVESHRVPPADELEARIAAGWAFRDGVPATA